MGGVLEREFWRVKMKKIKTLFMVCCFLCFSRITFAYDTVYDMSSNSVLIPQLLIEAKILGDQLTSLTKTLDQFSWNDAQSKINDLGKLVNQANSIAYSAGNLDSTFRKTYPGYTPPENYGEQYENIVNTTLNTLNGILQSVGSSADDFADESSRLQTLQKQAQNADGQIKITQAAAQIASAEVEQLQLMRQTMIAQTNAQTAYYSAQIQKEASSRAEQSTMIQAGNSEITGKMDENPLDLPWANN